MSNLAIPIAVGLGGFVGAIARFYVSGAVARASGDDFSFMGTLSVNLVGCFLIGAITVMANRSTSLSPLMQKCLITGLLGSLTTFSTFALDSLSLLQAGRIGAAIVNVNVNVVAGCLFVWAGSFVAQLFLRAPVNPS